MAWPIIWPLCFNVVVQRLRAHSVAYVLLESLMWSGAIRNNGPRGMLRKQVGSASIELSVSSLKNTRVVQENDP